MKNRKVNSMTANPLGDSVCYHDGHYWIRIPETLHGDYTGSTVEKSNHDYLVEQFGSIELCDFRSWYRGYRLVHTPKDIEEAPLSFNERTMAVSLYGDYSIHELWIREDWEQLPEILESLQNYALLNEFHHEQYERELREDAIIEFAYSLPNREEFAKWYGREEEFAETLSNAITYANVPVVYEQAYSCYIDEDAVLEAIQDYCIQPKEEAY